MNNWVIIFSPVTMGEVYAAKNYLESEGIETLLQNEMAARLYANVADKIKLLVQQKDAERGTKILMERGYIKD